MYNLAEIRKQYIQAAKENINNGTWVSWQTASLFKPGDAVSLLDWIDENKQYSLQSIKISNIEKITNDLGFEEIMISGKVIDGYCKGSEKTKVISSNVPNNIVKQANASKVTTLYEDGQVTFDTYNDKYRLSFFKDYHWCGEIIIKKNGEIFYDSFQDPSC